MSEEVNKEWMIPMTYNGRGRQIKAELIYESAQIQRIKVYGSKSTITLQNNYPMARLGKKSIQWKLTEGNPVDPQFFTELLEKIERVVKDDGRKHL